MPNKRLTSATTGMALLRLGTVPRRACGSRVAAFDRWRATARIGIRLGAVAIGLRRGRGALGGLRSGLRSSLAARGRREQRARRGELGGLRTLRRRRHVDLARD